MRLKDFMFFLSMYLFLFVFNYFTPMYFGDDYLYSFIWEGHSFYIPLTENAERISSWHDLFVSQFSHYLTWSGRTVNHTIAQVFLWAGKDVFNIFNALVGTLLVIEIYWCIHKGKTAVRFNRCFIAIIFFALWSFTPAFGSVFFWLDGACNYLWTTVLLLGFLIPYIHKYYNLSEKVVRETRFSSVMFFFGLMVGWTNENSICWIIVILLLFLIVCKKCKETESWMYAGIAGLIIGYSLLMFAPGNVVRLEIVKQRFNDTVFNVIIRNIFMLFFVFLFHISLWFFGLKSIRVLKSFRTNDEGVSKDLFLAQVFCVLSFSMTSIMLISPVFLPRSAFPGTVQLIIAVGILFRVHKEKGIILIRYPVKRFLISVCTLYFIMTSVVTLNNYYETYLQINEMILYVKEKRMDAPDTVLNVSSLKKPTKEERILSGFHIPDLSLSEDENDWANVAFSRYYGIKGIRMVKKQHE